MIGRSIQPVYEQRSYDILKPFLQQNIDLEKIRITVRNFYKQIEYMQKRMRAELQTKGEKIEVLKNYWDLLFGMLQSKASKIKD